MIEHKPSAFERAALDKLRVDYGKCQGQLTAAHEELERLRTVISGQADVALAQAIKKHAKKVKG